jgi:hypothetical protein
VEESGVTDGDRVLPAVKEARTARLALAKLFGAVDMTGLDELAESRVLPDLFEERGDPVLLRGGEVRLLSLRLPQQIKDFATFVWRKAIPVLLPDGREPADGCDHPGPGHLPRRS